MGTRGTAGSQELLKRLAAHNEDSLRAVLAPTPESGAPDQHPAPALDRRTRSLVRLAALLALDAPTASVQWAVELAAAAGVDDAAVIGALQSTAEVAGSAQLVRNAPRVALSLGFDVEPAGPGEN
jgi:alkylhydroperoxidase/carboxymuconolactone decarboxylase family protein YurZ